MKSVVLASIVLVTTAASSATAAEIQYVAEEGNGYTTITQGPNGYDAEIGKWDTPYPYGHDCDEPYAPGEPIGVSRMEVVIDVLDGGILSFDWSFRTYDNVESDWLDIYVVDAGVTTYVDGMNHFGHHIACPGADWETGRRPLSLNLEPWLWRTIGVRMDVMQDGQGTQTQGRIWNLDLRTCPIAPLTPLSPDSLTQYLEQHGGVETGHLAQPMMDAYECLVDAVDAAGGAVVLTAAYRTPEYQLHLNEIWNKWQQLLKIHSPACDVLRQQVYHELHDIHHIDGLRTEPAGSAGPHTRGRAIDVKFTGPVDGPALAATCGLCQPLPERDPVHYVLCGGQCSCAP